MSQNSRAAAGHRAKALRLQQVERHQAEVPGLPPYLQGGGLLLQCYLRVKRLFQRMRTHDNQIPAFVPSKYSQNILLSPQRHLLEFCRVSAAHWELHQLFGSHLFFLHSLQSHLLEVPLFPCCAWIRSSPIFSPSPGAGPRVFPKAALCNSVCHSLMNAAGCGCCSISGGGKTLDMAMSTIPWHSSA